ncbi:MAG TPA: sensor domain-containing diguanylate cyclase [Mobilitalea sp.]|nr:sensor domain-containing diguanylate cyclase [Mobilitalea sp.]
MSEIVTDISDQLLKSVPGGLAKLALDDDLTILYATDTFYSLIKNVTDKVNSKAPLTLLKIVYSADIIYITHQVASQKNKKDNMITLKFRTLQSDGSFRWVMISGKKIEEIYQAGTKQVPVYSCMAMDVTDHMERLKKLEQEFDYNRTISELSKELNFEYEIAKDKLVFTELFREVFGRDSEINEFSKKLEKTKIIFPDEHPAVIKIFKSMMSGKKQVRFELRLIPKGGEPIWYICYASIIFDENKNPYKVIGKLATTNPMRKGVEAVTILPQLDSLTKVCTKDCAERMIIETLAKEEPDILSALMIFEIRNYKTVNEVIKLVNGENILTTIAGFLKKRFRSSDIIGRIGLNEFVVFLRGIRSDRNAYEKAELLCKEVDGLYSFQHNRSGLSISIGIAFTKGDQMDYPTLLSNSKAALVMAKKESISSFDVFYGSPNN